MFAGINELNQIRSGNYSVYNDVFEKYYVRLCSYSASIVNNDSDAEDIVQEVFISIWANRKSISVHTSLKSYLYSAVRNSCMNFLHHKKYEKEYIDYQLKMGNKMHEFQNSIEFEELKEKLNICIGRLPERCKRIFTLSRLECEPHKKIAKILDISISTIKSQMGKALSLIKMCLNDSYDNIVDLR